MKKTVALFALAGISLAGCSGSSARRAAAVTPGIEASTTSTTVSLADLGKRYDAAVAPINAAIATFNSKYSKLGPSATAAAVADIAEPVAKAFQAADQALLHIPWPDRLHQEAIAVVAADSIATGDLNGVRGQKAFSASTFIQQFARDLGRGHAAVRALRADLGMPVAAP